jgi:FAD/FMN-containing dehydrogenase
MVATNTGGSRVLRHGDMSTHVLGVRAVLADEEVSVVGDVRGLHKDNTGPDPTRLLVGSAGAFGIICAVAVRLTALPAERVTALLGPVDGSTAVDLLGDEMCAFEVMCPAALAAGLSRTPAAGVDPGRDPEVTVLVEVSGTEGSQDRLVEAVDTAGLGSHATSVPLELAWRLRHGITEGLRHRGEVVGFDLGVRPAELPALRTAVRDLVSDRWPALEVADFGHWGDGGIHCNVVVPEGVDLAVADRESLRSSVFSLVTGRFGGSWSAEHGIGPANAAQWRAATAPATKRLLAAHRAQVDPLDILGHPGLPF